MNWARGPSCLCEYETPRVVTVRHIPLGILKLVMQVCVLAFVLVFQLWHAKGYQTFAQVESSVTTKVLKITINNICNTSKTLIFHTLQYILIFKS